MKPKLSADVINSLIETGINHDLMAGVEVELYVLLFKGELEQGHTPEVAIQNAIRMTLEARYGSI